MINAPALVVFLYALKFFPKPTDLMQFRTAFRPMPLSHPARKRVERKCRGQMHSIPISDSPGPVGRCYWTAQAAAAKDPASSVQHGWLVNIYPRKLVFCVHHAVLRLPSGGLLDLTKYPLKTVSKVSFIPNDDLVPRLDRPEFIDQICLALSDAPEVRDYITFGRRQVQLRREIAKINYEAEAVGAGPAKENRPPPQLAALEAELYQNQRRIDHILAALAR